MWLNGNAERGQTQSCTCREDRMSWNSKQGLPYTFRCPPHCAPFVKTAAARLPLPPPLRFICRLSCFLAYKTRLQGQTSGLISAAPGHQEGLLPFLLTGDCWLFCWKACCTIVATPPLFSEDAHAGPPLGGNTSEEVTHLTPA